MKNPEPVQAVNQCYSCTPDTSITTFYLASKRHNTSYFNTRKNKIAKNNENYC